MDARCKAGFIYTVEHIAADGRIKSVEVVKNIMPMLGVNYVLGAAFKGVSQYTAWYVSLFNANVTPVSSDTMTTFLATCEENIAYTTTGGARLTVTLPAIVDGAMTTLDTPNEFAFTGASTVRGAFITTNVTRGNTAGLLISAVLFPSPKVMAADETLRVPVGFALVSS